MARIERRDKLKPEHAALVEELRTVYPEVVAKLVDVLLRIRSARDADVGLPLIEAAARGVDHAESLDSQLVLPHFTDPRQKLWPPPQWNQFAVEMAARQQSNPQPPPWQGEYEKFKASLPPNGDPVQAWDKKRGAEAAAEYQRHFDQQAAVQAERRRLEDEEQRCQREQKVAAEREAAED